MKITLSSPAKVNLFLQILGKRTDNYHDLFSLFHTIDLCDSITYEFSNANTLCCSQEDIPIDDSNLIWKAVHLFNRKAGSHLKFKINLTKQTPIQAGLGGGSSNAATTLFALNRLTGNRFSEQTLQTWSAEIGSDIPFFFSYGLALCSGRGEHVQELNDPLDLPDSFWIVKPPFGLSTPAVYQQLGLQSGQSFSSPVEWKSSPFFNDLEKPAFALNQELHELKNTLFSHGFHHVLMTGSGSAFYCFGSPRQFLPEIRYFPTRFLRRTPFNWY